MSKLSMYGAEWRNAEVASSEFITPDDGTYQVYIEGVQYSERDKDGRDCDPTFIYTFCITEGENKGQKFRRYTTIRSEKSASFFKGDLQKLGIPIPADPEDLPQLFLEAAGLELSLTVKTKVVNGRDYKDVYFNRVTGKRAVQAPQWPAQPIPQAQPQRPAVPLPQQPQRGQQPLRAPNAYYTQQAPQAFTGYDDEPPF